MTSKNYIGLRLDQFELLEEIGHGGSARVYRARDHLADRDVAVKIIPNDVEDRQDFIARFNREIEIVRTLAHEHIVEVYGFGETEEVVFLVMRLLDGGSLRTKLDSSPNGQLPVGLAALYASQMARALQHAHLHGIIHRDVKPSNMLFAKDNPFHLLLADFGIAKIQGLRGMTKSGIAIGTPEYMSPEQAEGKESDPRSDIYSLGIVLYEMLAGRPPFKGQSPVAIMYQHVHVAPAYIRGYNPQVPAELWQILETALRKHPDERFPTAEHMERALQPFLGFADQVTRSAGPRASGPRATMTPRLYPNAVLPYPPYFDGHVPVSAPLTPEEREQIARIGTLPPAVGQGAEQAQATPPPGEAASPSYPLRSLRQTYGPSLEGRKPGGAVTRRLSEDDLAMDALEQTIFPPGSASVRNAAASTADIAEQETLTRGSPAVPTGSPRARQRVKSEPLNLPSRTDGPRGATPSGKLLAGMAPASAGPAVATPPAPPAIWTDENDGGSGKKRPRRRGWVVALTVIVMLALLSAVAVSTGATRFLPHTGVAATPSATTAPTATAQPTATATAAPSGTATLTPQQQLDRQAFNSFSAVTLAKSQDGSCGSNTTAFSGGQHVYINMCTSSRVAPGPVTVSIRQVGGVCTLPPEVNGGLTPTTSYFCYSTFSLGSGAYDMVVSIRINGTAATARVIHFTVG